MRLAGRARQAGIGFLVVLATGFVGWSLLGVYSVSTYQRFLAPTREFLAAGLALDSASLAGQRADPSAVGWVLAAGRRNAAFLRTLEQGLYIGYGMRNGDRALVLFSARSLGQCNGWPLTVFFSGPPTAIRIQKVAGGCHRPGHA